MKTPTLAASCFILWIAFIFVSCSHQTPVPKPDRTPIIKKDTSSHEERDNHLFVFVGEKIEFSRIKDTGWHFDASAKAKYRILQYVYGNYDRDTIEFTSYDHYDRFPFADFETALIFVREVNGLFYQEKYMFDPVAKTEDGRWAGPYSSDYRHVYNRHTDIKPVKIEFENEIGFSNAHLSAEEVKFAFPAPYFILRGNRSVAVYGNYVPELFRLKKDGVLKARGLFSGGETIEQEINRITDSLQK